MKDLEKDIHSKIELFQDYSRDLILQRVVSESNREFGKLDNIQTYIDQKDQEWTSVPKETITPFMQKLMDNELSQELIEKARFYDEKHTHKVFGEIFVTNRYGAIVAQTGKTTDYRQDDEQWWQKAKRDGVSVADIAYDESSDFYSIDIVVRIDDKNGNFSGVIISVLTVDEIVETVKRIGKRSGNENIRFHLINREGKIIYCKQYKFFEDVSTHIYLNKVGGDQGYFEEKGTGEDKGKSLFSYAISKGYKDFGASGWILLGEQQIEEIFRPVNKLRDIILLISLVVTMFAILISLFISRRISNPITKLENATMAIGKGKLDVEIEVESNDEVGQLAGSFKRMIENLRKTTTSIDYYNKEIEKRIHTEEALRKSEEKYRSLTNNLNVGVYRNTIGPKGKHIEVNPAVVEMFGYDSREEYLKVSVSDLYKNPDDRKGYNEKILRDGFVKNEELQLQKKDGTTFIGSVSAVSVKDERGEVKYFDGIIEDITERKRIENQIKASLNEKDVLLREVHHRVKNNMQTITSLLHLGRAKAKDQEAVETLKDSENRIRAMTLVHETLYQSKDFGNIDLSDYVIRLANGLQQTTGAGNGRIILEKNLEPVILPLDRAIPCGLVMNELITNSLKHAFTEGATGQIKISVCPIDQVDVEIIISDNGKGFPESMDIRRTESMGLNLAVGIIEDQLDGQIELNQEKGTEFKIRFSAEKKSDGEQLWHQ